MVIRRGVYREDRHRVGVDLVPVEPDRYAELVIHGRSLEHPDDLEIVTRVRKRAGEQAWHVAAQLVEGFVGIGKADLAEQALELGQAQGAGVRGVAQLFQPVERRRLRWILGRIIVDDDDTPSRSADPDHLPQHRRGVEKMVAREPRGDDREAAVIVR
jgi:hypothetical protein